MSAGSVGKLEELIVADDPVSVPGAASAGAPESEDGGRAGKGAGRAFLQELKEDPGSFQLDTLLAEIVKLERVKAIGLPVALFEGASEKVVAGWRARAMKMYPSDFESAALPIRITLLAVARVSRRVAPADGVECGDAVGGGGVEVAAQAAPAAEGGQGMPVTGHCLVPFRGFRSALRDVICPAHGEVSGEQEDLFLVFAQPVAEGVAGVVPGRASPAAGCG